MNDSLTKLVQKRKKLLSSLPPLDRIMRGTVLKREVKCGKPYCHCAKGKGHTVWYVSTTHPSGKTEQISLPSTLVPLAQDWAKNYRKAKKIFKDISAINRDIIRQRRAQIKRGNKNNE